MLPQELRADVNNRLLYNPPPVQPGAIVLVAVIHLSKSSSHQKVVQRGSDADDSRRLRASTSATTECRCLVEVLTYVLVCAQVLKCTSVTHTANMMNTIIATS